MARVERSAEGKRALTDGMSRAPAPRGDDAERGASPGVESPTFDVGAGTFLPEIVHTPAPPTFMKLYERHFSQLQVANHADAPAETSFGWGLATFDGLEEIPWARWNRPGSSRLSMGLEASSPGATGFRADLQYQVPGGPVTKAEPLLGPVLVDQPTFELVSIHPVSDAAASPDRVALNDWVLLRVRLGNIDGATAPQSLRGVWTGAGAQSLCMVGEPGTLAQRGDSWATYDFDFIAAALGEVDAEFAPSLGPGDAFSGPSTKVVTNVEQDAKLFESRCNEATNHINAAYTRLGGVVAVIAAAYEKAWKSHSTVLDSQKASDRLVEDLIFNAALAFVPGGVGGYVGKLMKDAKANEFLSDGVKDMAKAGVRSLQAAAIADGGSSTEPLPTDPTSWAAAIVLRVSKEHSFALSELARWQSNINNENPEFFRNFDPVVTVTEALRRQGRSLASLEDPHQVELQNAFERGFWRDWLLSYGWTVHTELSVIGALHHRARNNVGSLIAARLKVLGVDAEVWMETFGGTSRQRAEDEAFMLNQGLSEA